MSLSVCLYTLTIGLGVALWSAAYTRHLSRYGLWYSPERAAGEVVLNVAIMGFLYTMMAFWLHPDAYTRWLWVISILSALAFPFIFWIIHWHRKRYEERCAYHARVAARYRKRGHVFPATIEGWRHDNP